MMSAQSCWTAPVRIPPPGTQSRGRTLGAFGMGGQLYTQGPGRRPHPCVARVRPPRQSGNRPLTSRQSRPISAVRVAEHPDTSKVTEHAPRGRDTSRNSLAPLGASESPRSALSPAVSVPRYHAPTTRAWRAGSLARKWSQATSTTGLVSSRYLGFGVSQIPRRHRQLAFPPIPTGTPSRLTALARSVPCFDLFGRLGPLSNLASTLDRVKPARPAHMPFDLCFRGDRKSDKTDRAWVSGQSRGRSQPSTRRATAPPVAEHLGTSSGKSMMSAQSWPL
jgi:hypothetical protein